MKLKISYEAPQVEIVKLEVEQGFAESYDINSFDDWTEDGDFIDFI